MHTSHQRASAAGDVGVDAAALVATVPKLVRPAAGQRPRDIYATFRRTGVPAVTMQGGASGCKRSIGGAAELALDRVDVAEHP
jgi:hypothetical protein